MTQTPYQLQRKIMRGVYQIYAMRVATHPLTFHVLVLAVALWALAQLVFVERVVDTLLSTEVRNVIPQILNVFTHADIATLVVVGICTFTMLSVGVQVRMPKIVWGRDTALS